MQNPLNSSLRQLSHVDKHLTSLQDANRNFTSDILKYSGSLPAAAAAGEFQTSNDFGFDRLRATTSTDNHNAEASCLSPLLLASSALSSGTQQTLPRMPLNGYPASNNQYGRNRIIPDVVAAAAAAAVVAAASIGRQRTSLTPYSKFENIFCLIKDNHPWTLEQKNRNGTAPNIVLYLIYCIYTDGSSSANVQKSF